MKRAFFLFMALAAFTLSALAAGDKYTLDRDALPEKAQQFLQEHFPKAKVGMIKVDRHLLKKTDYDVRLVNGTTIDFSNKGEWKEVDCGSKEVPSTIIPKVVSKSVSKNYPGTKIVCIKKKNLEYYITLSDGVKLKINQLGQSKVIGLEDD